MSLSYNSNKFLNNKTKFCFISLNECLIEALSKSKTLTRISICKEINSSYFFLEVNLFSLVLGEIFPRNSVVYFKIFCIIEKYFVLLKI